jgi:rhamnosyltransferase
MQDAVAIIMRSKDEMPHIRATLKVLERQTFRDYVLHAIDSGSTDGSLQELQRHCYASRLTRIEPDQYMPGKVLNEAIARTDRPFIVLLNGDAIPRSETWLEALLEPLFNDEADAAFSRQVARPDAPFIVAYDYQRAYAPDRPDDHFFSAAACAFKRELWERHKFPDEGYAEDSIWATSCRMLNAAFRLVPESEVEHSHNYSLRELYAKRFRHGENFARVLGETSPLGRRLLLCGRELARDLVHACRKRQFAAIPYNVAYRVTIHAGHHMGIRKGTL